MKRKSGFTLVELLVVIAIIGVLVALLLPAIQSAREAARRMQCGNNLKQQGLALHNYHDVYKCFPPALLNSGRYSGGATRTDQWGFTEGVRNHSGWLFLLPFMEQSPLYKKLDMRSATNGSNPNAGGPPPTASPRFLQNVIALADVRVSSLECPSHQQGGELSTYLPDSASFYTRNKARRTSYLFSTGAFTDYDINWDYLKQDNYHVYSIGMFGNNSHCRIADIKDGTANVFATGESKPGARTMMSSHFGPWGLHGTHTSVHGRIYAGGGGWIYDPALRNHANWVAWGNDWGVNAVWRGDAQGRNYAWVFGSEHPGGAQFCMGDASVQFIADEIEFYTYALMARITDGQKSSKE